MNKHIIHYILERVNSNTSGIMFMDKKGQYREYTYTSLWNDIKKYASLYQSMGVKKGDVISIVLPTSEDFIAAFLGANLIQAVPVSLYPPTSLAGLDEWSNRTSKMIESVQSTILVTDLKISAVCNGIVNISKIKLLITDKVKNTFIEAPLYYNIEVLNEEDLCFLQFSSGTTGLPKAVKVSQRNTLSNIKLIINGLPNSSQDIKVACWLPLFHDMGLVGCLLMSIVNGSKLVLIRPDDFIGRPHLWLKAMHDKKLNTTTAPNFAYGLVQKRVPKEVIETYDLAHVQAMLCGAEVVYKETMDKFSQHMEPSGLPKQSLLPVYGMAETTLAVSFTNRKSGLKFLNLEKEALKKGIIKVTKKNTSKNKTSTDSVQICSVGEILPTFKVKILDNKNDTIASGKVGRVVVSGPSVCDGYYNNKELTDSIFIDGFLDTGDEGFIFENELYICGRIKDTIIIRGQNYYPTVFEEKLYNIEGVRKGRAIVSSTYNSITETEEVVVLAEAATNKLTIEERKRIIKQMELAIKSEGLPIFKAELYDLGILKKTSSGKLKRRENIRLWREDSLGADRFDSLLRKYFVAFNLQKNALLNRFKYFS